ncbi:MAG: hypothetical protein ACI8X5_001554 [Planctomycetota bacterium]|jgi:hypothetical protein
MEHQKCGSWTFSLAALGLGTLLSLTLSWGRESLAAGKNEVGAPWIWLCDREDGRVIGLDFDGFESRSWRVAWPLEVAPAADGALWVLAATSPGPESGRRLVRIDARGERQLDLFLEGACGLETGPGESARLLVGELSRRFLVEVSSSGVQEMLSPASGAFRWLERGDSVLLAAPGHLWLAGTAISEEANWGLSLGPGESLLSVVSSSNGWFVLSTSGVQHVLRSLDWDLSLLWKRTGPNLAPGSPAGSFLMTGGSGEPASAVRLITRRGEERRFDELGELIRSFDWNCGPIIDGVQDSLGVTWLATYGACLRMGPGGWAIPGQGGFHTIVDLEVSPVDSL